MTLDLSRRSLFRGAAALLVAPAIVRVASIMPVKAFAEPLRYMGVDLVLDPIPATNLYWIEPLPPWFGSERFYESIWKLLDKQTGITDLQRGL